jgi:hypothetical protein
VNLMRMFSALTAFVVTLTLASTAGFAMDRDKEGYFHTGEGVRTKKVAFIHVKVYAIEHAMKELPAAKTKQAVIEANVDKKFAWKMLRSVDAEKIRNALKEAYAKNNYGDAGKIDSLLKPITSELKEGSWVTIKYDAATQKTTLFAEGTQASVPGEDFMKATWSLWFGNIDQPSLGDSLLTDLK